MRSEASIQKSCMAYAKKHGFWVYKVNDRFRSGIPDLMLIKNGQVFFVELKKENGVVSKIQDATMKEIEAHGVKCYVCYSVDEFKGVINAII